MLFLIRLFVIPTVEAAQKPKPVQMWVTFKGAGGSQPNDGQK